MAPISFGHGDTSTPASKICLNIIFNFEIHLPIDKWDCSVCSTHQLLQFPNTTRDSWGKFHATSRYRSKSLSSPGCRTRKAIVGGLVSMAGSTRRTPQVASANARHDRIVPATVDATTFCRRVNAGNQRENGLGGSNCHCW